MRSDALRSRQLGFGGKLCIHPRQVQGRERGLPAQPGRGGLGAAGARRLRAEPWRGHGGGRQDDRQAGGRARAADHRRGQRCRGPHRMHSRRRHLVAVAGSGGEAWDVATPATRPLRLEHMDYRTKEEQVADYLRERIISGVYARGSRLKQAEIAEELHLSITPVREALKLLGAEGYVSGDSYRGARVVPFDPTASAEILQLRLMLEAQLVRGAVDKATSKDIEELRVLADEFEKAFETGDRASARGINYRFHRRMYDIAGNAPNAALRPDPVGALPLRPDQRRVTDAARTPLRSTTRSCVHSRKATPPARCCPCASTSNPAGPC